MGIGDIYHLIEEALPEAIELGQRERTAFIIYTNFSIIYKEVNNHTVALPVAIQCKRQATAAHHVTVPPVSMPQSQRKPPEPSGIMVQQVESGSAHQQQHHQGKTQANSLSTPTGLFLALSTDPGGAQDTVKGGGSKTDHTRVT